MIAWAHVLEMYRLLIRSDKEDSLTLCFLYRQTAATTAAAAGSHAGLWRKPTTQPALCQVAASLAAGSWPPAQTQRWSGQTGGGIFLINSTWLVLLLEVKSQYRQFPGQWTLWTSVAIHSLHFDMTVTWMVSKHCMRYPFSAQRVCQLRLWCVEEKVHALDEPQEVSCHGLLQTHRQGPRWKDHTAGVYRRHPGIKWVTGDDVFGCADDLFRQTLNDTWVPVVCLRRVSHQ